MSNLDFARTAWRYFSVARIMASDIEVHRKWPAPKLPPLCTRIWEQYRLLCINGTTAKCYYQGALYRRDFPWSEKKKFMGEFEKWRWQSILNPLEFSILTVDKLIFSQYLAKTNIPTPEVRALLGARSSIGNIEACRTEDEIRAWLGKAGVSQIFIKPIGGTLSAGVLSLGARLDDGPVWEELPLGVPITPDGVLTHLRKFERLHPFIVQDRIHPHPDLAVYSPHILHTARITTWLDDDGRVESILPTMRIGQAGKIPADIFEGHVGILAPVDPDTGVMGAAAHLVDGSLNRITVHPTTQAPIAGKPIPNWEQAMGIVRRAARLFSFTPALGWDVGFSDKGPVIVEANYPFSITPSQAAWDRGALGDRLGDVLASKNARRYVGLGLGR